MDNFQTAKAYDNEIMKTTDFNYGYDAAINNMACAIQALVSDSSKNYVIGGRVRAYVSQGMNVSIDPLIAFCKETEVLVANNAIREPVSIEAADPVNDRIDIIQIKGTDELFDEQTRAYKDPVTGEKTFEATQTKKKIALSVVVKKGSPGSASAPLPDPGYIKLAEINIPAGTLNIYDENILNIEAASPDQTNDSWTTKKDSVFNPMHYADYAKILLTGHNPDGSHKNGVIKRQNIKLDPAGDGLNGTAIPVGVSLDIGGTHYTSTEVLTTLFTALANQGADSTPYANKVFSRFEFSIQPVAASTGNVNVQSGGEIMLDGIACQEGQNVLLVNQTDPKENGFWTVSSGAWSRTTGYTSTDENCFAHKFILVPAGTVNAGKIFYYADEECTVGTTALNFDIITLFSVKKEPLTIPLRDNDGNIAGELINLMFKDKTVETTDWVDEADGGATPTYADFHFRADIACSGVTVDFSPDVRFDYEAISDDIYAPVADTGAGVVKIWAKRVPSSDITIPIIICTKEGV